MMTPVTSEEIEGARRGALWQMLPVKKALVASHGIEPGFALYRNQVGTPGCDRLERKALRPALDVAREGGMFEIAPGGKSFALDPPRVIGEGDHRQLRGTTRTQYVSHAKNVRLRGRSAALEGDKWVALDVEPAERARIPDDLEFDPVIWHADAHHAWIMTPDAKPDLELENAFTLLGPRSQAFGHWMWDFLPRYVAATLTPLLPSVPVLIDSDMPPQHKETLRLYGARMIEVPSFAAVTVRDLWFASTPHYMPVSASGLGFRWDDVAAPPDRVLPALDEMVRRFDAQLRPARGHRRIYLARRPSQVRKLANHAAIEGMAADRGFEIVYPQDLSFTKQYQLVRAADFVLGPEGSAFFLTHFLRAGAKVAMLNHPFTAATVLDADLHKARGVDLMIFTGPVVNPDPDWLHHSDYRIDERAFAGFLDQWLSN